MTVLIFHALTTPERRPIQMGARLYDGRVCVSQISTYIRPDGWTLDAAPQTVKLAGRIGAPLNVVMRALQAMSECADHFAYWDAEEIHPALTFATATTLIKVTREGQRRDMRVASKPLVERGDFWPPEGVSVHLEDLLIFYAQVYFRLQREGLL